MANNLAVVTEVFVLSSVIDLGKMEERQGSQKNLNQKSKSMSHFGGLLYMFKICFVVIST